MANTPVTDDGGADDSSTTTTGKGRPTPTRHERVVANKRPLVQDGGKAARERQRAEQEKIRQAIARGDERYLPVRDKGPQRRYIRDFVDARWNVGELMMPVLALVLGSSFINNVWINTYSIFVLWGLLLFVIIDSVVLGLQLRKRLNEKFGKGRVQGNYGWYAAVRAMQLKFMRAPKALVKRGEFPE